MVSIKISTKVFFILLMFSALAMGAVLGLALARTADTVHTENFTEFTTALPTKLLDINGELITEFTSEERREIISLMEIPQHMKDALITREDRIFYEHKGFSIKAILRAFLGVFTGKSLGGGSTLTQQIAGTIYADRTQMTLARKVNELWWAIQMERRYSKNEIFELYLNRVYFGGGTYGVNAASKYYFGHDARSITPAESAILVIQLSNPAFYNPFEHPNRAMERQKDVLSAMVSESYITQSEADDSYDEYWLNFDYSRTDVSAFFMRDDKAPWFSEYVRRELSEMIYGDADIYSSGFTVNTTGNLFHLQTAQLLMEKQIHNANVNYKAQMASKRRGAFSKYVPFSELVTLMFNLGDLKMSNRLVKSSATKEFSTKLNPIVDVASLMFGIDNLKVGIINRANNLNQEKAKATTIEGTMVNLENDTGYITALIGGSKFDQSNQFIRASQARVQPGSSFKPLYFSAALDSGQFTAATAILDAPYEFKGRDGSSYLPNNYGGAWRGNVLLWRALALSLNIPALKVLEKIGFNAAIERSVALLGISEKELPSRAFVPGFPIGLGTVSVRPIEMARAYAIFANGGKAITPTAIRTVEDRKGNIILNIDRDVHNNLKNPVQVITPQNAFLMTKIMEASKTIGTLRYGSQNRSSLIERNSGDPNGSKFIYTDKTGNKFEMPIAGKTGTTQNWADAWAIGYSPYYTSAFWFGFDLPGNSMGMGGTGASMAGPPWGDFMRAIHRGLPYKDFPQVNEGVVKLNVCAETGLRPVEGKCGLVALWFLRENVPSGICSVHGAGAEDPQRRAENRLEDAFFQSGYSFDDFIDDTDLQIDLDLDSILNPESPKKSVESNARQNPKNPRTNSQNSRTNSRNSRRRNSNAKKSPSSSASKPKEDRSSNPSEAISEPRTNDSDSGENALDDNILDANILDFNIDEFYFVPMNVGAFGDAVDLKEELPENAQPGIENEIEAEAKTEIEEENAPLPME
ncbi:MAG: PBP1A family penicillin-binding protein [Treponemataceae bacterium]|nr:PBP1A family penicillin-binding protein [Treponemataceae bacterium]